MIKKFNDFEIIEEGGIIKNIKDFVFKKKSKKEGSGLDYYSEEEERPIRPRQSGPSPEPSNETDISFPCIYSFLTKELVDRKRERGQKHIAIRNDGYAEFCETPEELEEAKEKYKIGNKYNGETISTFDIGKERNY